MADHRVIANEAQPPAAASFVARVAALFRSQPNTWISSEAIAAVGGRCGWRSRASDCRTQLGMVILNRVRRVKNADGRVLYTVSEYMFVVEDVKIEEMRRDVGGGASPLLF